MPVETPSLFAHAIKHHLELKRQNADLEPALPLDRYLVEDPFENHPLFKTEEQARLEETMDGEERFPIADAPSWPEEKVVAHAFAGSGDDHWGRSRDFDWGD